MIGNKLQDTSLIHPGISDPHPDPDAEWLVWVRRFAIAFLGLIALAIFGAVTENGLSSEQRLLAVTVGAAYGGWMWTRGQWSTIRSNADAIIYFSVSLVLLVIALRLYDGFGLVIFGAYWQGFSILRLKPSLVYAAILTVAIQVGYSDVSLTSLNGYEISTPRVLLGIIGLMVAGLMAAYIESVIREGERRQALLYQLRATQDALAAQEREAGVIAERQRLAGEIHDTVAQHFTSIVTNLEAAESRADTNIDATWDHIRSAREAARHGIADARSMVHALQPQVLEGRAIGEALDHITRDQPHSAPDVTFREIGTPAPLERVRETILVRALQEALQNVRKHAHATSVAVSLAWLEDEVILDVQDDGAGFDPRSVPRPENGHRMGLHTMPQRVESAGGTWSIESTPGEGTSIAISFPLDRVPKEAADE
jgi:signal transduction histidine kinase